MVIPALLSDLQKDVYSKHAKFYVILYRNLIWEKKLSETYCLFLENKAGNALNIKLYNLTNRSFTMHLKLRITTWYMQ